MILIAVGTQKFPLNRLLKQIDDLIESGDITEEVFAQTGNSDYKPKHYKYKPFLNTDEFDYAMKNCSMLITHGGVASIIKGLMYDKPVIVYPRLSKFGEHVDDHQNEISVAFAKLNYVLHCGKNDSIVECVNKAKTHKFDKYETGNNSMITTIKDFIESVK